MKLRVGRRSGHNESPLRPFFARQNVPTGIPSDIQTESPDPIGRGDTGADDNRRGDVPTGIPSDIQTDSPDADDAEPTSADDKTKTQTHIATVTKTRSESPTETGKETIDSPDFTDDSNPGGGWFAGTIAGIVVSILAFLVILAAFIFWRRWRKKRKLADTTPISDNNEKSSGAADPEVAELDSSPVAELEGSARNEGAERVPQLAATELAATERAGQGRGVRRE